MNTTSSYIVLPFESKTLPNMTILLAGTGMLSSVLSIAFAYKELKLNIVLKSLILYSFFVHFVLNLITLLFITHLTHFYEETSPLNQYYCVILSINQMVVYPGQYLCNTLISVIKAYITWKVQKLKIVKSKKILSGLVICFILYYFLQIILMYLGLGTGMFFKDCMNITIKNVNGYKYLCASIILDIFVLIIGLFMDFVMVHLVKTYKIKEQKKQIKEPIPWKSGNHAEESLNIPAAVSITNMVFFLIIVFLTVTFDFEYPETEFLFIHIRQTILLIIVEPITIYLILQSRNNKKISPIGHWKKLQLKISQGEARHINQDNQIAPSHTSENEAVNDGQNSQLTIPGNSKFLSIFANIL